MKKGAILLLIIIVLISCSNKHKKEYYKSGRLKKDYTLNDSGQFNGTYKEYYENGNNLWVSVRELNNNIINDIHTNNTINRMSLLEINKLLPS